MRGLRLRVRRWGKARLLAVGALAIVAIFAAVALPSALLAGGWATLPANLLAGVSAPAHAAQSNGSAPHTAPTSVTSNATPPQGSASPGATRSACAATAEELAGEQHLLALINAHRAAAGVPALAIDPTLTAEARAHSCGMYQHHHLSHAGSDGSSPSHRIAASGVKFRAWGENIGESAGYALLDGLDRDDRDMMAEPLTAGNHHWNLANRAYTRIGPGVTYVGIQLYFTEDFVG
jgi:uncharacterized protein YkwD